MWREREKERERGFEGRVQGCFVIEDRLHNKRAKKKYHQVPVRFQIYRLGYKNDLISKNVKV